MTFNIIFLIILSYYTYKGYKKGLLFTLISSVASWIGVIVAISLSSYVAELLFDTSSDNIIFKKLIPILSYVLVFFATVYGIKLLGQFLKKTIRMVGAGNIDKLLGGILAGLTTSCIASLAVWVLSKMGILNTETFKDSSIYYFLMELSKVVINWIGIIFPFLQSSFENLKAFFSDLQLQLQSK
jgi:uncharacterized membrane protein required for colicin V production